MSRLALVASDPAGNAREDAGFEHFSNRLSGALHQVRSERQAESHQPPTLQGFDGILCLAQSQGSLSQRQPAEEAQSQHFLLGRVEFGQGAIGLLKRKLLLSYGSRVSFDVGLAFCFLQ